MEQGEDSRKGKHLTREERVVPCFRLLFTPPPRIAARLTELIRIYPDVLPKLTQW